MRFKGLKQGLRHHVSVLGCRAVTPWQPLIIRPFNWIVNNKNHVNVILHHHKFRNRDIIIDLRDFFDAMQIFRFPTIPSDHQPRRQNTNHGFSCKRSRNTFRNCNRAMWHAAISVVVDCMELTFNFPQRYWFFMTKQYGGNYYSFFMIAAAVVRQPYSPMEQFHPWAVGLSHCGSRKTKQQTN